MVLLSFLLQVAAIGVFRQYHTRPGEDNFGFGFEMGRVGRSIALGQGFSNPYGGNTGPTAWEPPLYPYLIAGVFKIFGIQPFPGDDGIIRSAVSNVLQSRKLRSRRECRGCLSFRSALASIWRMRSRVTENRLPTSSNV